MSQIPCRGLAKAALSDGGECRGRAGAAHARPTPDGVVRESTTAPGKAMKIKNGMLTSGGDCAGLIAVIRNVGAA